VIHIDPPQVNGYAIEGQESAVVVVEQPPPPPKPQLYDMDLGRIHAELYQNKYLTPIDFLHNIRKILRNAEVRATDDLERLYEAQAMLTATEVSLNDFDQTFRLECERVTVRGRRRRDDRKERREKEKAEREKEKGEGEEGKEARANEAAHNDHRPTAAGEAPEARPFRGKAPYRCVVNLQRKQEKGGPQRGPELLGRATGFTIPPFRPIYEVHHPRSG